MPTTSRAILVGAATALRRLTPLLMAVLSGAAYFLSARVSYRFAIPGGIVTLWLPSGLMLGLFLRTPRRDWPWLIVATIAGSAASDYVSNYPPGFVVAAALANAFETAGIAWLVARYLSVPVQLTNVRGVVLLAALGAIGGNAVTAAAGALAMHGWFPRPLPSAWLVWWAGDGLAMLIITPMLLVWGGTVAWWRSLGRVALLEAAALIALLVVASALALGPSVGWYREYMVFPLLFWAALRFGLRGSAIATLIIAAVATWNAALGLGPFFMGVSGIASAVSLYVYLGFASQLSLILAAVLSERAEARQRLLESEDRYRGVVSAATDGIITIDTASSIQFANPAIERIFGYAPEELVGRALTQLMPPELADRHRAGLARYLATGKRHIAWQAIALPGLHRDGRHIPIEISFGELTGNGRHLFTGVIRDVSDKHAARQALQLAEERMRFALEAAKVGVWEVNLRTGVSYWSATCEAMHGVRADTFGKTFDAFFDAMHRGDRDDARAIVAGAIAARTDALLEYRVTLPDAEVRVIRFSGRFVYDESGTPVRGAGVTVDVTEQRALEDRLRQSQKMEVLGQLAGGIAHDFNNILTAIQGYGALVMEQFAPDNATRKDLHEIQLAAQRAESLTRQLLAFSRRQILAPKVLDLADLVRRLEPMLRRLIGEHIQIVVRTQGAAAFVRADPGQLEQVILNLAVNARDAMPEGGTLELEVTRPASEARGSHRTAEDDAVLLIARDTGVGMSDATKGRIFEPFFTTKPPGRGTGLGLATVHGILQQSGGRIDVHTELGRGTTFTVTLPAVDGDVVRDEAPGTGAPEHRGDTILVVEDDAALRKLIFRVLERAGYGVVVAATPEEALEIAGRSRQRVDLLLTDVVLPGMNGRALADKITQLRRGLKVLYMSGYTDDEVVRLGVLEQHMHFLPKPFAPATLLKRILETLDPASSTS